MGRTCICSIGPGRVRRPRVAGSCWARAPAAAPSEAPPLTPLRSARRRQPLPVSSCALCWPLSPWISKVVYRACLSHCRSRSISQLGGGVGSVGASLSPSARRAAAVPGRCMPSLSQHLPITSATITWGPAPLVLWSSVPVAGPAPGAAWSARRSALTDDGQSPCMRAKPCMPTPRFDQHDFQPAALTCRLRPEESDMLINPARPHSLLLQGLISASLRRSGTCSQPGQRPPAAHTAPRAQESIAPYVRVKRPIVPVRPRSSLACSLFWAKACRSHLVLGASHAPASTQRGLHGRTARWPIHVGGAGLVTPSGLCT